MAYSCTLTCAPERPVARSRAKRRVSLIIRTSADGTPLQTTTVCDHSAPGQEAPMAVHQNYINGEWAKAPSGAPNINPSNVTEVVGEYARADEQQVRAAIAAARAAFPGWSRGSI